MVVLPMLNGGRMEKRWQPMSQLTWKRPSSFSTSFMAVKSGRSGQPVQKPAGRAGTSAIESGGAVLDPDQVEAIAAQAYVEMLEAGFCAVAEAEGVAVELAFGLDCCA